MFFSEAELSKRIKNGKFDRFYIFYGEEYFLIKMVVKNIINCLVKTSHFNYKSVFFDDYSFEEVKSFFSVAPVFCMHKVFLIKYVDLSKLSNKDIIKIGELLNNMPYGAVLIFTIKSKALEVKKNSNFKKLIDICGDVVCTEFNFKNNTYRLNMFTTSLKKRGFSIEKEDMLFLINRGEKSIENISLQFGKICAFVEKGQITKNDIVLLTKQQIENSAFDITKNLLAGRKKQAVKIFYNLFECGFNMAYIFSAVSLCFIDMYRAKLLKIKNINVKDISKYFNYSNDFRIKNAILNSSSYSLKKLRQFIFLLAKIDVKVKTTNQPINYLLEKFLFYNIYD